jgi:Tol biopolymer transport system component
VAVDARSDVFSLGAMIYEMVAGRKPFQGETASDTLASILKTEPPSLSAVIPGLPSELNRIVSKCLRKDREERYQVVKDLWLDLKSLKQDLEFQEKLERSVVPDGADTRPREFTSAVPAAQTTEPRSAITLISESLSVEIKRHKVGTAVSIVGVLAVLALAAFGIYRYSTRTPPVEHFWEIKLSRITSSGDVIDSTVSPDGKYVVYARSDRSTQSLYIRQVSTANEVQILAPAPIGVFGMTFSPDGSELYYAIKSSLDTGTLYRIPVLGGTPIKILQGIDGPISFAPDGKHFVLVRANHSEPGESALVISNLDGSEQRDLVVKKLPERFFPIFFAGPSWSSDGKLITAALSTIGRATRVVSYSADDGTEHELTTKTWVYAARTQWLPDMSGVLVVAGDEPKDAQLWFISYPEGKARRVTNDLNAYRAIGLTQDGKRFTTVQAEGLVNLYVVPNADSTKAVRLPTGNVGFYGTAGNSVSWLPDGRIVLSTNEGGEQDIWVMNTDGTNRKQLTANEGQNISPVTSPDGTHIVFTLLRNGVKSIWRINSDGSNPLKITSGVADTFPSVTPDNKYVIYTSLAGAYPTLWKVSIDGGTAEKITERPGSAGRVSPDGKQLMFLFAKSQDPLAPPNRIAVVPFGAEGEAKDFPIATSGTTPTVAQWSRDGKSIIYSENANNVSNLWSQPIDDSPRKQITDFKDSLITGFAWSYDGTQLACTRGVLLRDAVLVTDMK